MFGDNQSSAQTILLNSFFSNDKEFESVGKYFILQKKETEFDTVLQVCYINAAADHHGEIK